MSLTAPKTLDYKQISGSTKNYIKSMSNMAWAGLRLTERDPWIKIGDGVLRVLQSYNV